MRFCGNALLYGRAGLLAENLLIKIVCQPLRSPRPLTSTKITSSPNLHILFQGTIISLPPLKIEVMPHCPGTTIASIFPQETSMITSHMQPRRLPSHRLTTSFCRKSVYRSLIFCASVLLFIIYCMRFFLFYCFRQYNRSAICSGKSGFSACSAQGGPSAFPRPARRRD